MIARRTFVLIAVAGVAALFCFRVYSTARAISNVSNAGPRITTVDFYGLRRVTRSQVDSKIGLRTGDAVPVPQPEDSILVKLARALSGVKTKQSLESALREIPGVTEAAVVSVYEGDPRRYAVFAGISEDNALPPRRSFQGSAALPAAVAELYVRHQTAFVAATRNPDPDFDEDDSKGYALFTDTEMRRLEERAIAFMQSPENRDAALTVLRSSADAQQRRGAAWLLSYGSDLPPTAAAMTEALDDPDDEIRNTACRELILIAEYGVSNPARAVRIAPEPFVKMLNSVVWTDRDKALGALDPLTASRNNETLTLLRSGGLASLVEMARWNAQSYARMAYVLVGRIAGLAEADIEKNEGKPARDRVIQSVLHP